jgi:proline iminopeptidase
MTETGFVSSPAGELYFEQMHGPNATPLVCIHGGPGFTGYYLEPLFELSTVVPVVIYDQAGCGRSRQRCPVRKLFTVDGFVEELEALRKARGFEAMHLLGHSFGGLIAGEYALKYPERVSSIIFACVSIDIPRWVADGERLVSQLPLIQKMVLREGLRTGQYNSPQFLAALAVYYQKHVYGFEDKPASIIKAEAEADSQTYQIMWGANELAVTGLVKDYNLAPRLELIWQPSLCVCGRFDEATPEAHQFFTSQLPNSRCHIFENSAHHPQLTEREGFLRVVSEFLGS